MRIKPAILIAAVSVLALSGCNTASKALGLSKVTPDEFRIVTKAPLVVPPDYALRPPAPGEPRPQELQPDSAARAVLVGQVQAADRSAGENRFVARAGAAQPDPLIRFVVDDENGDIAHKDQSFASRVMLADPRNCPISPAACQVVPLVSCLRSSRTISVQPALAR